MWFDVAAALAELGAQPAAGCAIRATPDPEARPVSRVSQVSQPPDAGRRAHVAEVATVATPPVQPDTPAPSRQEAPAAPDPDTFRHGRSLNGDPLTWTGRIVPLHVWRDLSEWERHGPNGRVWCGVAREWRYLSET